MSNSDLKKSAFQLNLNNFLLATCKSFQYDDLKVGVTV